MKSLSIYSLAWLLWLFASQGNAQWKPADGPLMTRWAKDVSPERVHSEYPRPQLVRDHWQNLNGLWQYAIRKKGEAQPKQFDGQILVPFPIESSLSGVKKTVGEKNELWYRRDFTAKQPRFGHHMFLHFGAVDWFATVWVNGKKVGTHQGGYDPFSFDITDPLNKNGQQIIVVRVWDPTDRDSAKTGIINRNSLERDGIKSRDRMPKSAAFFLASFPLTH